MKLGRVKQTKRKTSWTTLTRPQIAIVRRHTTKTDPILNQLQYEEVWRRHYGRTIALNISCRGVK